jgi:hypothetical protein
MDQGAVGLRAAEGGDAISGQERRHQRDRVLGTNVAKGEGHGSRFARVNRAVDGSALIGQDRARVNDLRRLVNDRGNAGSDVVVGMRIG